MITRKHLDTAFDYLCHLLNCENAYRNDKTNWLDLGSYSPGDGVKRYNITRYVNGHPFETRYFHGAGSAYQNIQSMIKVAELSR